MIISSAISTNSFSYLQSISGRMRNEKKKVAIRCPALGKCRTSAKNKVEFKEKYFTTAS